MPVDHIFDLVDTKQAIALEDEGGSLTSAVGPDSADPDPTDGRCPCVVGLDCITGLQTTRRLSTARGIPVVGVVADRRHFCARTRVSRAIVEAQLRGDGLVDALERLAERLPAAGRPVPCTDAAVLAISAAAERSPVAFRFVLPEHDVVERLMDKVRVRRARARIRPAHPADGHPPLARGRRAAAGRSPFPPSSSPG